MLKFLIVTSEQRHNKLPDHGCNCRDIWSAARAAQERPDSSYRLLAIDFLPAAAVKAALTSLSASLASGLTSSSSVHMLGAETSGVAAVYMH